VARNAQCCVHTCRSHTRTSLSKPAVSSASDILQITRIRNSAFCISAFCKIHLPAVSQYSVFIDCGEIQRGLHDQSALDNVRIVCAVFRVQLLLVEISEVMGFGRTFSDREPLSDVETELNDVFAIQFHTGRASPRHLRSSLSPDQVPILAINVLPPHTTTDNNAM